MKKYISILATIALFASCTGEMDTVSLPSPIPESSIEIVQTDTATPNIYEFSVSLDQSASLIWDLDNGSKPSGLKVTGSYPFAGEYTVKVTVLAEGGMTVKTKTITVESNNYDLVNDPTFNALTGGIDQENGKTWMIDATTEGHLGCGDPNNWTCDWWNAAPNDKAGKEIYDDKLTFVLKGAKVTYANNGKSYVNGGAAAEFTAAYPGASTVQEEGGEDHIGTFTPADNWSWTILKDAGKEYIVFPDNQAFVMFYTPKPHKYEIMSISDDEMYLRQQLDGIAWYFRLIREGFEKPSEPEPEKPLKVAAFTEDFESEEISVPFKFGDMGDLSNFAYANPAPVTVNTSATVCLYQKSTEFYSNMSFDSDYRFDLTTVNKIKVKVFIPSYNDYDTDYDVAGDWISNKKLLPQLAVKLQDTKKGGDAWQTQTEIVKADLDLNKWLELEFDFSGVSDRTDYDKVVVQFGAEGHAGPGIFFMDDFRFAAED